MHTIQVILSMLGKSYIHTGLSRPTILPGWKFSCWLEGTSTIVAIIIEKWKKISSSQVFWFPFQTLPFSGGKGKTSFSWISRYPRLQVSRLLRRRDFRWSHWHQKPQRIFLLRHGSWGVSSPVLSEGFLLHQWNIRRSEEAGNDPGRDRSSRNWG